MNIRNRFDVIVLERLLSEWNAEVSELGEDCKTTLRLTFFHDYQDQGELAHYLNSLAACSHQYTVYFNILTHRDLSDTCDTTLLTLSEVRLVFAHSLYILLNLRFFALACSLSGFYHLNRL